MLVAILGFYFQNISLAMTAVLLMGLQSALYSPAKYGLIKDIGGVEGVSMGMGGMEAFAFLGMLIGICVGSVMSDHDSLTLYAVMLITIAALGLLSSLTIKANETKTVEESSANPIKFMRESSAIASKYKGLGHIIMLLSLFWWFCSSVQIIMITHCDEYLHITNTQTGYLLAAMAIGITAGCLIGGKLNQNRYMLGVVPRIGVITGLLMVIVFILPFNNMGDNGPLYFGIFMTIIAIIVGIFKIPLDLPLAQASAYGPALRAQGRRPAAAPAAPPPGVAASPPGAAHGRPGIRISPYAVAELSACAHPAPAFRLAP